MSEKKLKVKMLVACCLPPEGTESHEPRHLSPGAVVELDEKDARLALEQGTGAKFSDHDGCPECAKLPRGCCSQECFVGMGGPDSFEAYHSEMSDREASLREQASRKRAEKSE